MVWILNGSQRPIGVVSGLWCYREAMGTSGGEASEGGKSLGTCPWRGYWNPCPFFSFCFLVTMKHMVLPAMMFCLLIGPKRQNQGTMAWNLKPWAKTSRSFIVLIFLKYFVTLMENFLTQQSKEPNSLARLPVYVHIYSYLCIDIFSHCLLLWNWSTCLCWICVNR